MASTSLPTPTAATLPAALPLLPMLLLPPPMPRCRHRRRTATTLPNTLPLPPKSRLRQAAPPATKLCHRRCAAPVLPAAVLLQMMLRCLQAATKLPSWLPLLRCHHHRPRRAVAALLTPPLHCPWLPPCCRATATAKLPLSLTPRHHHTAAVAALPPPPPRCCCHRRRPAVALPAAAALLPLPARCHCRRLAAANTAVPFVFIIVVFAIIVPNSVPVAATAFS
jgi:hypothetical protein